MTTILFILFLFPIAKKFFRLGNLILLLTSAIK